jgi:hypothetical protein
MSGRSRRRVVAALTVFALAPPSRGLAQEGEVLDQIETLAADNAPLYLAPITLGIGASLNRGAFHTAATQGTLGFSVGVAAMGAWVPDADDTFVPVLPAEVTYRGVTYQDPYGTTSSPTPTVAGAGDGVRIQPGPELSAAALAAGQDPDELALPFPDGLDFPIVPFAVLQASLGLPGGTDVSVRGFPSVEVHGDVGSVSALGFGVTHSLSQYLPLPMLNLAAHVSWQSAEVGDYLDADALGFGLIASIDAGPLSVFGAGIREDPEVTLGYTVANPDGNPALPRDGLRVVVSPDVEPATRFTAGATLNLLAFKLSAAWTSGDYQTLAVKALVSID